MKKIVLGCCLIFILFSCKSKAKEEVTNSEKFGDVQLVMPINNHSFLTEDDVGISLEIWGELRFVDDEWILIESPDSKSMVSFILNDTERFEKILLENIASKICVHGVLTKVHGAWIKEMALVAIEENF